MVHGASYYAIHSLVVIGLIINNDAQRPPPLPPLPAPPRPPLLRIPPPASLTTKAFPIFA